MHFQPGLQRMQRLHLPVPFPVLSSVMLPKQHFPVTEWLPMSKPPVTNPSDLKLC